MLSRKGWVKIAIGSLIFSTLVTLMTVYVYSSVHQQKAYSDQRTFSTVCDDGQVYEYIHWTELTTDYVCKNIVKVEQ